MFFNPEKCRNETEVESKFVVQYLLPALGYTPETWHQEVSLGNIRPDFLVHVSKFTPITLGKDSPLSLVIEVKSPKYNLTTPHVSQLKRYLNCLNAPYGLLTNGKDFRIFERNAQDIVIIFGCKGTEIEMKFAEIKSLIGREEIRQSRFGIQSFSKLSGDESAIHFRTNSLITVFSEENHKEMTNNLQNAVQLIKAGEKQRGGQLLAEILKSDSQNEVAWWWMADVVAKNAARRQYCLQQVLTINPDNQEAQKALISLKQRRETQNQLQQQKGESRMKTIAVYHNKGGVGKTTTVVNLAAALSKQGKKILIVDLDSQANTTFAVGLVTFDDEANDTLRERNILHVLSSEESFPIKEIARPADFCFPAVDVVPAHIDLMGAENDLNSIDYSRLILVKKLREVAQDYDVTIIDTPPSLNLYARIALIAADYFIIPSDLKPFANQGLKNVKELVKEVNGFRKIINREPIELLGVLASKILYNSRFRQSTLRKRMQAVEERYRVEMMESIIFERDEVAKCSEDTKIVEGVEIPDPRSVLDFKPESKSAQEFNDLASEILRKIG